MAEQAVARFDLFQTHAALRQLASDFRLADIRSALHLPADEALWALLYDKKKALVQMRLHELNAPKPS